MKKVAIFMSDFHLGQKDRMEEFHADQEFAELLGRLSREHKEDEVDLVLLGDVMDLWTTITAKEEINARKAQDVDLYFPVPAGDPQARADAVAEELQKVREVMAAHAVFFDALGQFLSDAPQRRRILYIPGNHDHSVVEKEQIQPYIRDRIVPPSLHAQKESLLQFPTYYYDDTVLQVYAEHGNQLTYGGAYRYTHFDEFGEECPGYFELKLVWNRLERKAPEVDNVFMGALSPGMWPGLFGWLLLKGNLRYWFALRKLKIQYEHDPRAADARKQMPPWWKSVIHMLAARWQATGDEFWDQVPQLFDKDGRGEKPLGWEECKKNDPAFDGRLNPVKIKTAVLGHSHQTKDKPLPSLEAVKYYNTGSWIFRYENGHRIVEQTWLRISAEKDGASAGGSIVDRQLFRRRVEFPQADSSPTTKDGRALNPAMREMPDIRVGDVALFHWNFGATTRRLLKSYQLLELVRQIPHMVRSWLNRYGSNSYWSHAALIYGAPSEREETDDFTDPLFLEALPDTGVGIHGPRHYLTYRTEWNLAIVRPKAPWLNDWQNRRHLRRMAVSILDADYDNREIQRQALVFSTRMMDEQGGKETVTALFKGGMWGVGLSTAAVLGWGAWSIGTILYHEGWAVLWDKTLHWMGAAWAGVVSVLEAVGVIGLLKLFGVTDLLADPAQAFTSNDPLLLAIGLALAAALTLIGLLAIRGLLRLAWTTWTSATAAIGAAWGVVIIPLMAELSDGWQKRSTTWRWAATGLWTLVPVLVVVGGVLGVKAEILMAFMVSAGLLLVWFARPFTTIVEWLIAKPFGGLTTLAKDLIRRLYTMLGWIVTPESKKKPHFICSGLVQYAFVITARELNKKDSSVKQDDVIVNPKWKTRGPDLSPIAEDELLKSTVHQAFADAAEPVNLPAGCRDSSKKFDWIYLLKDGVAIHQPRSSQLAEVEPDRLTKLTTRKLSQTAAWSMQMALLGLYCTTLVELDLIADNWDSLLLWGGLLCGAVAVGLAYKARRQLALNPEGVRGRWLTRWGGRLGYAAIYAALAVSIGPKTLF